MVRVLLLEAWAFFSVTSAIIVQDRSFRNFKKIRGRTELFAPLPSPARAQAPATEYHSLSTVRSCSRLSSNSFDGDWDAYAASAAEYTYSLRIVNALAEVDRDEWTSLVSSVFPDERSSEKSLEESSFSVSLEPLNAANPFLQYEWLNLLETTGCASVRMGWQPIHLLIYRSAAIGVGADNLNDYLGSNDNASTDSEKQSGDDFARTQPSENSTDVDMVKGVGSSTAGAGETSTASSSYAERYQHASVVERPARLIGAMPLYAKYHSQGEFIFDQSWASFAESRLSVQYYPKLLGAVPFTPAAGPRILLNLQLSDLSASVAAGGGEGEGFRQQSREVLEITESKHRAQILRLVARFLQSFAIENKLSSANVNFLSSEAEIAAFKDVDYDVRETIQYRWQNLNKAEGRRYESFDDYLSCFKSKRRIKIRAERKKVYEQEGITVRVIRGDDDAALGSPEEREAFFVQMHRLYTTTIEKMWGSEYLNEQFFRALSQTPASFRKHLVFIVAYDTSGSRRSDNLKYNKFRDRNSGGSSVGGPSIERLIELFGGKPKDFDILADSAESNESKDSSSTRSSNSSRSSESSEEDEFSLENIVAGTINFVSRSHFYGRYWGTYSYVPNLHFEVCYYRAIEFCIEQGVDYLEPGAGGGEFKFLRGFDPYTVYSVHWFQNKILRGAVAQFLEQERDLNQEQKEHLIENSRVSRSSSSNRGQPSSSPPASPSDSK